MAGEVSLDDILDEVGHFGKFQAINFFLVGLPILLSATYTLSYVFTAGDLEYRCYIPECEEDKSTFDQSWLENAVPYETRDSHWKPKRCKRYEIQNKSAEYDPVCPKELFNDTEITCDDWVYETEERTIVNEWSITCDENSWKLTFVGTINNIGQFVGYPLAGFISDRLGRRTSLVLSSIGSGVMGLARSFAWRYEAFIVFEFLDPIFNSGIYSSGFILGLELVGANARVLGSTLVSVFYALGEAMLGALAWWLQDWRTLLRVLYVPSLMFFVYYWLLPESVRWLMTMGKNGHAKKTILRAAKTNGVVLSEQKLKVFDVTPVPEGNSGNTIGAKSSKVILRNVLSSRILIIRIIICSICWATVTFVFYGLSLTSVTVGGNKYTNFILAALIELPGYFVFYLTMDRFGRKPTLTVSMVLSGLSCLSFIFVPADLDWLRMILFLFGKFSITISFTVLYVYTAEMFPTELRHFLLGICATGGRIGSIIAPQTPLLEKYLQSLPLILFGSLSIMSGVLSLYFPETLNMKLPDTVHEAEKIGKPVSALHIAEEVEVTTELEDTAEK